MALSKTQEEHMAWCGLLEAKIRRLLSNLGRKKVYVNPEISKEEDELFEFIHVNPEIFQLKHDYFKNDENKISDGENNDERPNSLWFIGLKFKKNSSGCTGSIDLTETIQEFADEGKYNKIF